jgi:hypothetical protein
MHPARSGTRKNEMIDARLILTDAFKSIMRISFPGIPADILAHLLPQVQNLFYANIANWNLSTENWENQNK